METKPHSRWGWAKRCVSRVIPEALESRLSQTVSEMQTRGVRDNAISLQFGEQNKAITLAVIRPLDDLGYFVRSPVRLEATFSTVFPL